MKIKTLLKHCWLPALSGLTWWTFACPLASQAALANVSIEDFDFNPSSVTINVNDRVLWTWNGASPHSSTSNGGIWDSMQNGPGFTFSWTFSAAGSFPYFCTLHPFMTGTVTVQAVNRSEEYTS